MQSVDSSHGIIRGQGIYIYILQKYQLKARGEGHAEQSGRMMLHALQTQYYRGIYIMGEGAARRSSSYARAQKNRQGIC